MVALFSALAVGLLLPRDTIAHIATRFLIAWNAGALIYLIAVAWMVAHSNGETITRRARRQSESRFVELALVLIASLAALVAIVAQLSAAKNMADTAKIAHLALASLTILSAWVFIHTMFALHYAHDYFDTLARHNVQGITFPGTPDPEYGDFFYCAFIIGTSGQTADVSFTSKPLRRVALVHSVLAFLFNTTMLAMTINIAAGFF
jgi:uncharacterized membrane protein